MILIAKGRNKEERTENFFFLPNSDIPAESTPTHTAFRRNIHPTRNLHLLARARNQLRPGHLRQPTDIRRHALLQPPTLFTAGKREEAPADVGNEDGNAIWRR